MAQVEVTMPKMGESITEGTIITWHKQPGDTIEQDETLLEIGTDKVDTDVPSPAAGVLQEILVQEGDIVEVGTKIAVIETDVDAAVVTEPTSPAPAEAEPAEEVPAPAPAQVEAPPAAAPSGGGEQVDVVMPQMGESITEGTIIAWHKQIGDKVELDEALLEIGTDKVDTEVPSPAEGYLAEIRVQEGDTVDVGTVIAVLTSEAGAAVSRETPAAPAPEPVQAPAAPAGETSSNGEDIPRKGSGGQFFSPLVRSIAQKEGISLSELESIKGSGREGRITKQDVMSYLETRSKAPAPQTAPQPAAPSAAPAPVTSGTGSYDSRVEIVEMDRMRQIIAEHMVRSKATSAHVTSFAEADVTNLVKLREKHKQAFLEREGVKLTFTPFFVQAAVEALRDHPILNASVEGTRILIKKDIHIGIAVAIGRTGLLAPVIRYAGQKNISGLARTADDLANRARNKKLQPDELSGGTFTVTNIGSLGSIMGTPVINQPQVAILATGAIKKRPVVIEDPNLGDVIGIRHMINLSLSYDHRIIDGAMAASFMQKIVRTLEAIDPDGDLQ